MEKAATGGGGGLSSDCSLRTSGKSLPIVFTVPKLAPSLLISKCSQYGLRPYMLLGYGDVAVPALFVALCLKFDLKMHPNRKLKLYHMVGCFGEHHVTFYFQGLAPFTDWWKCRLHHWACCHLPFPELGAACPASSALPRALHSDWCAGHCPGVGGAVCVPHWEAICECHVPCC